MKNSTIILIVLLGSFLAIGCGDANEGESNGDGGGGDGGDVNLQVDEEKPINELTEQEAQDVCGDIYDIVSAGMTDMENASADVMCTMMGVSMASMAVQSGGSDADVVSACEETVTACENGEMDEYMEDEPSEQMTEEAFCEGADESISDCNAATGDVADCMVAMFDAQYDAFKTYMEQFPSCSELTVAYYENAEQTQDMAEPETPAECVAVMQQCPEMFEDME